MVRLTPAERIEGVTLDLTLSPTQPVVGQDLEVLVVATNRTDQVVRIVSPDSGLVILRLWRQIPPGWTEYLRFPESALQALHPWSLQPGAQRQFKMTLPVDDRWPTHDTLRLTAELNGHIAESRHVELRVSPATR